MFKKLSIKTQIQILSISTIVFVLVIVTMANYIYTLAASTQATIKDQQLPTSQHSRYLNNALAKLINHQKKISSVESFSQLDIIEKRSNIEKSFEFHWQQLAALMQESSAEADIAVSLHDYYLDFISLDDEFLEFTQQKLYSDEQLQQKCQQLQLLVANLMSDIRHVDTKENAHAIKLLHSLNEQTLKLEVFVLKTASIQSDEMLDALIQSGFDQVKLSARADLAELSVQLEATSVSLLSNDFEALFDLIGGNDGITTVLKKKILVSLLLRQTQESISALISLMLDKQGKLTESVNQNMLTAISEDAMQIQRNRWKIFVSMGLLSLLMIVISIWLIRSIKASLQELRNGMHALSEGKFETRLTTNDSHNEIDRLALDFNCFAEKTEQLFEDYAFAQDALEKRKQHLRAVLNAVPEAILTVDAGGVIVDANPAAQKTLDASLDLLLGEDLRRFFFSSGMAWGLTDIINKAKSNYEFDGLTYQNVPIKMEVTFSALGAGEKLWACVISDVTAIRSTNKILHQTSSELNTILDNVMVGIAVVRDRTFMRVNLKFESLFGYNREEVEGLSTQEIFLNTDDYKQIGSDAYQVISQGMGYKAQLEMRRKNGEVFWCALSGKVVDFDNPDAGVIWLFEDVTQQRLDQEHLLKLASQDTLTGLPNRTVFNDRLAHAIHKAHRNAGCLAIFFMDLDHFKTINDSLGHRVGDMLLIEVGRRIESSLREDDTVARLGGDEFTVILEDLDSPELAGMVAEKVLMAVSRPYMIEGSEINISPSIGISLYPENGQDADILIRNADVAMYHAKKTGRGNFQFYSADLESE